MIMHYSTFFATIVFFCEIRVLCKKIQHDPSTGLFIASVTFDTPLISVVDGPILKSFGVVIVITVRFDLVYDNA